MHSLHPTESTFEEYAVTNFARKIDAFAQKPARVDVVFEISDASSPPHPNDGSTPVPKDPKIAQQVGSGPFHMILREL